MRICAACGRENPDERDFCECGEYLRWEPTGFMSALTAEQTAEQAEGKGKGKGKGKAKGKGDTKEQPVATSAATAMPAAAKAAAAKAAAAEPTHPGMVQRLRAVRPRLRGRGGRGNGAPATAEHPTAEQPTAETLAGDGATPAPTPAPPEREPDSATLTLKSADPDAPPPEGPLATTVTAGGRGKFIALIRNQSGIVDNYELRVTGLPEGWWSVSPTTVYLVPYGARGSGTYEQEVEITLHPPRTAEAEAREWKVEVVAISKVLQGPATKAPARITIEPYQQLETELRPERMKGRRRARYMVALTNRSNAPTEVALGAQDAEGECRFRFAQTPVAIDPGERVEVPAEIKPPKQIWLGRPLERRFQFEAKPLEAPAEDDPAAVFQLPKHAAYRQLPWLPWWLAIVIPLLLIGALLLFMLLPRSTTVPDLTKAPSAFEAQKLLDDADLKLSPQVQEQPSADAKPGTIIDQTPKAGESAKEGSEVSIQVATGNGEKKVPSVVGKTPADADKLLREAGLALGAVQPSPPDPKGKIGSQIPAANEVVKEGAPVNVFLEAGGKNPGDAGDVPKIEPGADAAKAAQQLSEAGLVPEQVEQFGPGKKGTVISTVPTPLEGLKAGDTVKLLVSAGFPQVAFDNGRDVLVMNGADGKGALAIAKTSQIEQQPTWSADGTRIVYRGPGKRLWLSDRSRPDAPPAPITDGSQDLKNPSFAPSAQTDVLAMVAGQNGGTDGDLCFAEIQGTSAKPDCIADPDFDLGRQISWSPDGTQVLVFGVKPNDRNSFGLILYTSEVAFSTKAADWGKGKLVTDSSRPGRGALAGAWSPDGKQLAIIANTDQSRFHLFLTGPSDFSLAQAKALAVRGCDVAWRADGVELALTQADSPCQEPTGVIVRVDPTKPDKPVPLRQNGAHPAFQPLKLGK